MSGLCSKHFNFHDPTCPFCTMEPEDIFPDWEEKKKEAEAAGTHVCVKCGFKFYLTISSCPLCGHKIHEQT